MMTKTNVGGLPNGSYIVTDNSAVIAGLNKRIENLERYNAGLANESCEQQARIAELEAIIRGRDELINNAESSRIAELEKERDEFKAIACSITPEIIDFVRCGIGANYGGSCYTEKMEKTYAPILASFKALKEQDNG
jgi:hypothetical protein